MLPDTPLVLTISADGTIGVEAPGQKIGKVVEQIPPRYRHP
jgi:hypothetical protein